MNGRNSPRTGALARATGRALDLSLAAGLALVAGCGTGTPASDASPPRPNAEQVQAARPDSAASTTAAQRAPVLDSAAGPAAPPTGAPPSAAPAATDGAGDPASVVRGYYDAISARDFVRAYASWSDSGRASGQTLGEFERGFDQTAAVTLTVGPAGRIEGAAGSRYVDIPVALRARRLDGSVERYRGTYTLRRAVVPGATKEQRAWRLYKAHLEAMR